MQFEKAEMLIGRKGTLMGYLCKSTFIPFLGLFQYGFPVF